MLHMSHCRRGASARSRGCSGSKHGTACGHAQSPRKLNDEKVQITEVGRIGTRAHLGDGRISCLEPE